jgi:membrane protease YdiL (CAAX protease family)
MLFSVKNRLRPTLLLLAIFVTGALVARRALGLRWNIAPYPHLARDAVFALLLIVTSDALVHLLLILLLRQRYLARFQTFANYFRSQGPPEIVASGLLAGGGEELVFRGVLLQSLLSTTAMGTVPAVAVTAILFGAMHTLRDPRLAPFALWAVWQGILLGTAYVATGSLLLTMIVHAAHDGLGFTLLALRRRMPYPASLGRERQ